MSIEEAVQEALEYMDNPPTNEADTCDQIIRPLLHAAGYAHRDINSRLADNNGQFPDYTILRNDPPHTWFIEVKAWNVTLKQNHVHQALDYANHNGKWWVVLTNGREWHLYDNRVQGVASAKQVLKVFLKNVETMTEFLEAIGKQSVCSDELEATAYAMKQRQEEDVQAEAWRVQVTTVNSSNSTDLSSTSSLKDTDKSTNEEASRKFWQQFRQLLLSKELDSDNKGSEWNRFYFIVNYRKGIDKWFYVAEPKCTKVEYVLNNPSANAHIAHYLYSNKEVIEQKISHILEWPKKFEVQKYKIKFVDDTEFLTFNEDQWPAIQENMIRKMLLLQKVLAPFIEAAEAGRELR